MSLTKSCDHCGSTITPATDATHGLTITDRELGEIRIAIRSRGHVCHACVGRTVADALVEKADVIPMKRVRDARGTG